MTKRKNVTTKAAEYTHSVWSGKKYAAVQTNESLAAESLAILRNHPTIGRLIDGDAARQTAIAMERLKK